MATNQNPRNCKKKNKMWPFFKNLPVCKWYSTWETHSVNHPQYPSLPFKRKKNVKMVFIHFARFLQIFKGDLTTTMCRLVSASSTTYHSNVTLRNTSNIYHNGNSTRKKREPTDLSQSLWYIHTHINILPYKHVLSSSRSFNLLARDSLTHVRRRVVPALSGSRTTVQK